ncbi:MAG: radical SAM protein [Methanoregula sp.]|jgi:uncharacterized protein
MTRDPLPDPPEHRFSFRGRDIVFDPGDVRPSGTGLSGPAILPVRSIALDISGTCNLQCRYCAESSTLPARNAMSIDILERSLDFVFSQGPENHAVAVHLGSGEPLLQPSLVRMIGKICRTKEHTCKKPVDLYITTNGTLLDEGMIGELEKHRWNVKVSVDGPADIHDRFRTDKSGCPTFHRIGDSLRRLAASMPETTSTTSVLCHGTDPSYVFSSLTGLGVRKIEFVPVASCTTDLRLDETDLGMYREFLTDYVCRLMEGEEVPTLIRFRNKLRRVMGFFNSEIGCDAGRTFMSIGPDGIFYPCFRFVGLDPFAMGSIDNGVGREKQYRFVTGTGRPYHERECAVCWASPVCGGPCFAVTELFCHGRPDPVYCAIVRAETEAAIYLAEVMRETDPERLLSIAGIPVMPA